MAQPGSGDGPAEQLATLALCGVVPTRPLSGLAAAAWSNRLLRLGVALPLFFIHDVGWLLAAPRHELRLRGGAGPKDLVQRYQALLANIADSSVVQRVAELRPRDELIAVILARLLGSLAGRAQRLGEPAQGPALRLPVVPLPLDPNLYGAPFFAGPTQALSFAPPFLRLVLSDNETLHLLTAIELLDVSMLRLLSSGQRETMSRSAAASDAGERLDPAGLSELLDVDVDLMAALDAPEARDVVRFSLDLLPSVLETRRSTASQQYPIGGYASIERRGSLDAVLLSELAYDDGLFLARLAENELLYYGRERRHDEARREHQILIDASASMHGLRQVFARGLAIALGKKLMLQGASVRLRFFDGRLYEPVSLQPSLSAALPYLLSFRSSRGRHYGRVFSELWRELQGERASHAGPTHSGQTLHILTHGQCHIPTAIVQSLSRIAWLHGVFVLPAGKLALGYLPLLRGHSVVTDEALQKPEARRAQALGIVAEARS